MKIRIAASIALAAGLALGVSGCSLFSHNGTEEDYAPSDGVQVTSNNVALRNILLIADEAAENFNVVFTAVNKTGAPAIVQMNFEGENGSALLEFEAPEGVTSFGNAEEGEDTHVITLRGAELGSTIDTYFTVNGQGDMHEFVPVLDGTLLEYAPYVLDEAGSA